MPDEDEFYRLQAEDDRRFIRRIVIGFAVALTVLCLAGLSSRFGWFG